MRIEDMKKIVDRVVNIQKTQGVKTDINSMPDGFMLTTFDETGMIKRVYISEREGVGDAICTIERLEKCINSYKERKKESMEKEKNQKIKYLEEICHEESNDCLNMFYKSENDIAAIVIVISNKVFISGTISFYKSYSFFRSEVERMRVSEMRKMFEKLENIETETKSMIEVIMQGARERFIVYALTNNRTLARTEINFKSETGEFECDFESFKKNVIDKIKQMHDEQREKEREIIEYLNNLACYYNNEKLEMFYKIKNIEGEKFAKILWMIRDENGTEQIIQGVPLDITLKEFKCKIGKMCKEVEYIITRRSY